MNPVPISTEDLRTLGVIYGQTNFNHCRDRDSLKRHRDRTPSEMEPIKGDDIAGMVIAAPLTDTPDDDDAKKEAGGGDVVTNNTWNKSKKFP